MKPRPPMHIGRVLARAAVGLAFAAAAIAAELGTSSLFPASPFLLVYPAVVVSAWLGGWPAGLSAIVACAFGLVNWLLPPDDSIAIAARRDAGDLAVFCGVSLLIVRLIADLKRALADARSAAEAATNARDAVIAVVAHDLRNPLQTIGLNADLLSAEVGGHDQRIASRVMRIHRAAARARRLVDNVLDSARINATPFPVEKSVSSLSSLLDETVSPFKALADARSIDLHLPAPQELAGSIVCDHDRIVQVLSNLVGNALQYTPRGGKIDVDVRRPPGAVRFEVTDTGEGMTEAELSHAFDRLWHGEGPGHGSGLGLWIAKALVEAHGGTIEAASARGKGTKMAFVLPQPAAASSVPAAS